MTSSKKPPLNGVQRDCLERQGNCVGCCNVLYSGECQVKWTEGVAEVLGLEMRHPARKFQQKKRSPQK